MADTVVIIRDADPLVIARALQQVTTEGTIEIHGSSAWHGTAQQQAVLDAVLLRNGLNTHERALVLLDMQGRSRAEIAAQLHLAPASVTTYWRHIYAKLGVEGRSGLRQWLEAEEGV